MPKLRYGENVNKIKQVIFLGSPVNVLNLHSDERHKYWEQIILLWHSFCNITNSPNISLNIVGKYQEDLLFL